MHRWKADLSCKASAIVGSPVMQAVGAYLPIAPADATERVLGAADAGASAIASDSLSRGIASIGDAHRIVGRR